MEDEPAATSIITAADAELLQSLLTFYTQFAERNGGQAVVQLETAKAYHRIGDIRQRLGQLEKARAAYQEALTLYDRVAEETPGDLVVLLAAVDALNQRGIAFTQSGNFPSAMRAHRRAKERLLAQSPAVAATQEFRFALAQTYNYLGSIGSRMGMETPPAKPMGERRPARFRGSFGPPPDKPRHEDYHALALEILEGLTAEEPASPQFRLALAHCYRNRLRAVGSQNQAEQVAASLEHAIEILRDLHRQSPDDPEYLMELADMLAINNKRLGATAFGQQTQERVAEAVQIARQLNRDFPDQPEYLALLVGSLRGLADILREREELAEAEGLLIEATTIAELMVRRYPLVFVYVSLFCRTSAALGDAQRQLGKLSAARRTLEIAADCVEVSGYARSKSHLLRNCVAQLYSRLMTVLVDVKDAAQKDTICRELQLSEDQYSQVKAICDETQQSMRQPFEEAHHRLRPREDRQQHGWAKVQTLRQKSDAQIDAIIGPDKRARFKEIQLQLAVQWYGTASVIQYREISQALQVTHAQQEQLRRQVHNWVGENQKLLDELTSDEDARRESRLEMRAKSDEQALSVLTVDQKSKLQAMLGASIDFEVERPHLVMAGGYGPGVGMGGPGIGRPFGRRPGAGPGAGPPGGRRRAPSRD